MKNWYKARREELRKRSNKGFTLMEMLIVVAIIAVLIAIAIPVFTSQLENSREATDAANLRSKYAEVAAKGMTENSATDTVEAQQRQSGWDNQQLRGQTIGDYTINGSGSGVSPLPNKTNGSTWTLTWDSVSQKVSIS